jgi:hypothetical protein
VRGGALCRSCWRVVAISLAQPGCGGGRARHTEAQRCGASVKKLPCRLANLSKRSALMSRRVLF